jgi:GH15 family glucan-1,4-alpha-glucosidase
LIDAFHQSRITKLKLDDGTWDLECTVLDHLAEVWNLPDNGIWERRGDGAHYVSSKVMTWLAFDRGIKSAEEFGFKAPLDRWRSLRSEIHRDVCTKGFDVAQNTFVVSYGSELLDASILLLPSVGFLPASDPRVRGTLAAIEKHMMRDGFVLRHDPREISDEKQPIEGAFLACTLWLADAYVLAGEVAKAQVLFDRVVAVANDLGLLAEEFDSGVGRQTGNFPQALTHIALINTAHNLSDAKKPVEKPAMQRSK